MDGMTICFRELIANDVTDRKMPNIINRGKAAAAIVTAVHREQIMESKRVAAQKAIEQSEKIVTSELKRIEK